MLASYGGLADGAGEAISLSPRHRKKGIVNKSGLDFAGMCGWYLHPALVWIAGHAFLTEDLFLRDSRLPHQRGAV